MLKSILITKIINKITCCRGTPKEYFEAKLLDIISYINRNLRNKDIMLHITDSSDIELWSKTASSKLGNLNFSVKDDYVSLTVEFIGGRKFLLGSFDPKTSSKSIADLFTPHLSTL